MKSSRALWALLGVFLLLGGAYLFTRPRGGGSGAGSFTGLSLPTADGESRSLESCAAEKCLTVYLAPWCGVCRASTGMIQELVPWLAERGVPARIVIGRDKPGAVREYAETFGPGTMMDPSGKVPLMGGVPQFIVSDGTGRVLLRQPGVPEIVQPPVPDEFFVRLASFLELPVS